MKNIPNILKYIKIYKFNSVFLREFIAVLLVVLIPLSCLNLTLFFYGEQTQRTERMNQSRNILSKAVNTLDTFMQTIDKISSSVMADEFVQLFMVYPNQRLANKDISNRTKNIQSRVSAFVLANDLLDSIYVYSELNDYIISDNTSNIASEFSDNDWYDKYKDMSERTLSWMELRQKAQNGLNDKKYLSFFKVIKTYNEKEGVLVVNMELSKIESIFISAGATEDYTYFILDNEDKILHTNDFDLLGQDYYTTVKNTGKNESISMNSDYNNWKYIYNYPKRQKGVNTDYLLIIIVSVLLSIVAPVLIAYFVSLRIFKPLSNILSEVEKIEPQGQEEVSDEFKYISRNLLSTFSSYQNAEKELAGKLLMLKKSQTVALQSQINPHFLFNTLETINLKAAKYFKGENDISSMINSLSKLLRLGIETQDHLTTIEKELEHAKTFVEILSVRYADKVNVSWDIDKCVLNSKICKITLQPIIENAMYHGIKPLPESGLINIKCYSQGDKIVFIVKDNGVGMEAGKIAELNEQFKNNYIKEDESIGFSNVNQRIKLILGEEYGIYIYKNAVEAGISVKITIPKI